ncbi:hypothetical protein H1Z61_01205 [Bacillus aquiflavi]|uniref:Uncharacterized protein n=1 Tax=Bacillus aquiflavi TaxID=2672567 RepID=A0A6B3VWK5_9BACI|nr:YqhR family membrane protein [Bacillus aquiflavi]MBA4535787.1 hypothetical protein [Bacillus aquiflavi]NEY80163.1 hypothetical protein [Bacillus aquiflavi]
MPEEQQNLEQNQREDKMSFIGKTIVTGFIAGVFWSSIGQICYGLNLTEVSTNMILEPWAVGAWKNSWLGIVISILLIGFLSIGVALLYYVFLKKIKSMWAGIGYGVALFFLVFLILNPIFPEVEPLRKLEKNSIITLVCLYILYGVFIGYSISYEENEFHSKENSQTTS